MNTRIIHGDVFVQYGRKLRIASLVVTLDKHADLLSSSRDQQMPSLKTSLRRKACELFTGQSLFYDISLIAQSLSLRISQATHTRVATRHHRPDNCHTTRVDIVRPMSMRRSSYCGLRLVAVLRMEYCDDGISHG